MRFSRLLIIITFFIITNTVYASEQPNLSGSFWEKLTKSQRTIHVMGVLEGVNYGNWETWLDLAQEAKNNPPKGIKNDVSKGVKSPFDSFA